MNILITGAMGATGKYLYQYLDSQNEKHKFYLTCSMKNISPDCIRCDLNDKNSVLSLLQSVQPDQIYHLAGSFSNDFDTDFSNNVITTKNIFDAILKLNLKTRVLIIGSSAEYGCVDESENPISEDHALNPCSIYGLTKAYQTQIANYYFRMHNIDVVTARTFNLLGANMSTNLFIGKLYASISMYKNHEIDEIKLGNLDNKRDYISIEEAIQQYMLIMIYGKSGQIYNVGSGKSESIYDILIKILHNNHLTMDCIESSTTNIENKFDIKNIFANIQKLKGLM